MNIKRAGLIFFLPFVFFTNGCASSAKIETEFRKVTNPSFGNIDFDLTQADFEKAGFHYDDLMKFTIHNYDGTGEDLSFEAAFVKNYNEVGYFAPCLCNYGGKGERPEISFGIMPQKNEAEYLIGKEVTIEMIKRQGYHRTRELVDVATKLTYEELGEDNLAYANFRDVTNVGTIASYIPAGRLFRGSSPFNAKDNPDGRDIIADAYLEVYGIESEVSLANSDDEIEKLMQEMEIVRPLSPALQYYKESLQYTKPEEVGKKKFFAVNLGGDYYNTSVKGRDGDNAKSVFNYIASRFDEIQSDAMPIYFHCNEGKDRTGFIAMVLEALCGCPLNDIVSDAMLTFKNYYNVSKVNDREKYDLLSQLLIYRQAYSILIEDPVYELPRINWYEFDAKQAVEKIVEEHPNAMHDGAINYLSNVLELSPEAIKSIKSWLSITN